MIAWWRRWFRRAVGVTAIDRESQARTIRDGLHDAASRVHYLEVKAALQARRELVNREAAQNAEQLATHESD